MGTRPGLHLLVVALLSAALPRYAGAVPLQKLHTIYAPGFERGFGQSVASGSGRLIVGAPDELGGAAYVFRTALPEVVTADVAASALVAALHQPPGPPNESFGCAVAPADGGVVVSNCIGEAYLFSLPDGALLRTFLDPHPVDGEDHAFSTAIAASGSRVVVAASGDGAAAGAAYVFEGASGALLYALQRPLPHAGDSFGRAIAVVGDVLAISRIEHVELFDASTGAWLRTLAAPEPQPDASFGSSLAVLTDQLLVGASPLPSRRGYVFDVTTGALLRAIENPAPAGFYEPSSTVAVFGDSIAIGAPSSDAGGFEEGLHAGAAYVFDAESRALRQTVAGNDYLDDYGRQVTALGRAVVVTAGDDVGRIEILSPCGDGIVDPTEQCDDGNVVNGDGCDDNCTPTGCGNGRVSPGEECDDGNLVNTDTCTAACRTSVCGDGIVAINTEQCDDGNRVDGDGCEADCRRSPCVGGARLRNARIVFGNLGPPYGDEEVRFTGTLAFDAAASFTFDPAATGAQVIVRERGNPTSLVWPVLPAGAPGLGCDPLHDGWSVSADDRVHVYTSTSPGHVCHPEFHYPHTRFELRRRRTHALRIDFVLRQTSATVFQPPAGVLRAGVVLGEADAAGDAGRCGMHAFEPTQCRWNRPRTRLVCH